MNRVRSILSVLNRYAGQIAIVVAVLAGVTAVTAIQRQTDSDRRGNIARNLETNARVAGERRQRLAQARSQVKVSRLGCQDRNTRDAMFMEGLRTALTVAGVPPYRYAPLTVSLSARNCNALYPQPDKNGKIRRGPDGAGLPFKSCHEAKTAGVAHIYRGQTGYSAALDADGDGVACE